jgi:hypothetical protein
VIPAQLIGTENKNSYQSKNGKRNHFLNDLEFAGTWKMYSKKASPQLIRITPIKPMPCSQLIFLNCKCPYQAKVMNRFDKASSKIVYNPFIKIQKR